ncbi:MAG TPA: hypothetical protein PK613_22465 [Anaerolineaceae bacterium]|nr:hypothetical protein [Anaerolineaceae bacterium]
MNKYLIIVVGLMGMVFSGCNVWQIDPTSKAVSPIQNTVTPVTKSTMTSTPVITLSPTRVVAPTTTKTPFVTKAPEREFWISGPFSLLRMKGGHIVVEERQTGRRRSISGVIEPNEFLGWTKDSCGFYRRMAAFYDVVEVNLNGEIVRTVYENQSVNLPGYVKDYEDRPSPDFKYVTIIGLDKEYPSGDIYGDKWDLLVRNIETNEIIPLSQNGGAYLYAWAADGKQIAYLDFDSDQSLRLYTIKPDGTDRRMISNYPINPEIIFGVTLLWSPDGQYLSLSGSGDMEGTDFINLLDNSFVHMTWGSERGFWTEDGKFLIEWGEKIHLFNPANGEKIKTEDNWLRLKSGDYKGVDQIIPSLSTFPGEINCPNITH